MIADLPLFHQHDTAFFSKAVPIEKISFKLLSGKEGSRLYLSGPKAWDAAAHPSLPLALVWKIAAGTEEPGRYGHLIFSEASGKGSFALPLNDFSGKVPMEEGGKASDSPAGASTPSAAVQYSTGNQWYELSSSTLPGGAGRWTAALLSAGSVSNTHAFTVRNKQPTAPAFRASDSLVSPAEAFGKKGGHPVPPKSGVDFKVYSGVGGKGSLLFGSFALQSRFASGDGLLLTAFISGKETADIRAWTIRIPAGKAKRGKNLWVGYFTLDLEARLKNPQLPSFELPKGLFVTWVAGDWIASPRPLTPR